MHQPLTQFLQPARERAGHLLHCQPVGCLGACGDYVGHGLGLRQVHAPVNEGTLRELARPSGTCAQLNQPVHRFTLDPARAMHGDLHRILAGERVGSAEQRHHGLVQHRSVLLQQTPQMCRMRRAVPDRLAAPHRVDYPEGLPTRYPDHGQTALAGRCGYGGYGIGHFLFHSLKDAVDSTMCSMSSGRL